MLLFLTLTEGTVPPQPTPQPPQPTAQPLQPTAQPPQPTRQPPRPTLQPPQPNPDQGEVTTAVSYSNHTHPLHPKVQRVEGLRLCSVHVSHVRNTSKVTTELLRSDLQNARALSAERPCSVHRLSVLCLQNALALSVKCPCSVRAPFYYVSVYPQSD